MGAAAATAEFELVDDIAVRRLGFNRALIRRPIAWQVNATVRLSRTHRRARTTAPDCIPIAAAQLSGSGTSGSGTIEIANGDTVVRVVGEVQTSLLVHVLRAVRRSS